MLSVVVVHLRCLVWHRHDGHDGVFVAAVALEFVAVNLAGKPVAERLGEVECGLRCATLQPERVEAYRVAKRLVGGKISPDAGVDVDLETVAGSPLQVADQELPAYNPTGGKPTSAPTAPGRQLMLGR